jgi:hypothetical protein
MIPFGKSSKSIVREINSSNFVLAGSLHAGICAFATGTPFAFSIDSSQEDHFKFFDFASYFGLKISFHEDFDSAMRWYVNEDSLHADREINDYFIFPNSLSEYMKFNISDFTDLAKLHTKSRNEVQKLKLNSIIEYIR